MRLFIVIYITLSFLSYKQNSPVRRTLIDYGYFKMKRPENAVYDAILYHGLMYNFAVTGTDGKYVKLKFKVWIDFVPSKSYFPEKGIYKDSLLLKHEQGHADIATINARTLFSQLSESKFNKLTYKKQISEIFNIIRDSTNVQHQRYDDETMHGRNQDAQRSWNQKFESFFR